MAISLAIGAAEAGRRVYYGTLAALIESLTEAKAAGNLTRRLRRRTLYEMIVEAKTRRGGDYGEHQAMPVNFPCRRRLRSTWFGGRIHPAHRFKVNDVKRENGKLACNNGNQLHQSRAGDVPVDVEKLR